MASVVGAFLQNVGREISEKISLLTTSIGVIIDGSSLLGRSLATASVGIVSFVYHGFQKLCTLCIIVIEDFYAFTLDASQTITAIADSLYSTYMWTNQSVWNGLNSVSEAAFLVGNKLYVLFAAISYGVTGIGAGVVHVLQLLKSAVILIGNESLSFFVSIPNVTVKGVVVVCQALHSIVIFILQPIVWIFQAGFLLFNSGKAAVCFFTDIPVSSYCGLLAGYVTVYSFWRYRRLWTTHVFGALLAFRSIVWQASNGFVTLAGRVSNRTIFLLAQLPSRIALLFRNHERVATEDEDISDTVDARNINLPRTSTPLPSSGTTQAKLTSKVGRITESTLDDSGIERLRRELELELELRRELERERDTHLCIVCQDESKCKVLLPCRHLCLCEACCSKILAAPPPRHCPVCRNYVRESIHVYL